MRTRKCGHVCCHIDLSRIPLPSIAETEVRTGACNVSATAVFSLCRIKCLQGFDLGWAAVATVLAQEGCPCSNSRYSAVQENELWKMTVATGEVDPETGKPVKKATPECGALVTGLLGVVALAAAMVEPYIPSASARIAEQLNVPLSSLRLTDAFLAKASQPQTIIPAGALNCLVHVSQLLEALGTTVDSFTKSGVLKSF